MKVYRANHHDDRTGCSFFYFRRVCGVHLFVVYAIVLAAVLGMSSACLSATRSGYFKYSADAVSEDSSGLKYEVRVNRLLHEQSKWAMRGYV